MHHLRQQARTLCMTHRRQAAPTAGRSVTQVPPSSVSLRVLGLLSFLRLQWMATSLVRARAKAASSTQAWTTLLRMGYNGKGTGMQSPHSTTSTKCLASGLLVEDLADHSGTECSQVGEVILPDLLWFKAACEIQCTLHVVFCAKCWALCV